MSHPDSDLLRKAATAMRTERTGHNAGSGFTRARILNDVRAQRKKRSRWWRIGFPIGIILAGTTAWASASGSWPEMLVNVSTLLNLPVTDNGASERSLATAKTTNSVRARHADALQDDASRDQVMNPELAVADPNIAPSAAAPQHDAPRFRATDLAVTEPAAPAGPVAVRGTAPKRSRHAPDTSGFASGRRDSLSAGHDERRQVNNDLSTPSVSSAPQPELEVEIRAFRRADDLYRRNGDLRAAIGAYRQYVRDYPTGRFVPEAKYNTALALVKLGRAVEARPLLVPFADGAYGSYRREAAKKLLHALP